MLEAVRTDSYLGDSKPKFERRGSLPSSSDSSRHDMGESSSAKGDNAYTHEGSGSTLADEDTPPPEPSSPGRIYSRHDSVRLSRVCFHSVPPPPTPPFANIGISLKAVDFPTSITLIIHATIQGDHL